jgi:hypothetical protein
VAVGGAGVAARAGWHALIRRVVRARQLSRFKNDLDMMFSGIA